MTQETKAEIDQEEFWPHQHYPNLNANAGANEAQPNSRVRKQAKKRAAARPTTPQPFIKLDSSTPTTSRLGSRFARNTILVEFTLGRVLSLIALIALGILTYWLLTSPNFYITKIEVKNSRYLGVEQAIQLTSVDKQNVFLLNENDMAAKLGVLPYVLKATIIKVFPDQVIMDITERKPIVNWKIGGVNYLVDQDGVILETQFDRELTPEAKIFPIVQSLDDRKLNLGDRVDSVAVRSTQNIQGQLSSAGFKISGVQYSPGVGLIVVSAPTSGNWKALLGTDAQLERKIAILKSLLAEKSIKWSYADLRFVDKPTVQ